VLVDRASAGHHLVDIALLPEHRRRGIGAAVLGELIGEAQSSVRPLTLSVARGNPALHLYRRLGFEPTGEDDVHLRLVRRPVR
jgi:ribosomal protein S18 acetylase RimI-like enzyme